MAFKIGAREIRTLSELQIEERVVFCRVDLNVPLNGEQVVDDTRIRGILPTLDYLISKGAKVVLASHLGRPKGKIEPQYSLLPIAQRLAELTGRDIIFPDDCIGDGMKRLVQQQKSGEVVLLENLRFYAQEERNDEAFAEDLKGQTNLYINDAFGVLHRAHASTFALPRLYAERAAGFLVEKELKFLFPLIEEPRKPYAVILGGAKVSDKIKVMENLLKKIDSLFLGGAMVFTFLKAMGNKIGNSLVEESMLELAGRLLNNARQKGVKIYFPKDFVLGLSLESPGESKTIEGLNIPEGWMGLDVGPSTIQYYAEHLSRMKTIFWNGPLGLYEKSPYDRGTLALAKILAKLSATRVIGGGDCAAAVEKAGVAGEMSHISTGGGATLEFLEGKALPGLDALAV